MPLVVTPGGLKLLAIYSYTMVYLSSANKSQEASGLDVLVTEVDSHTLCDRQHAIGHI